MACVAGCDQGTQNNEAHGGKPVEIVAGANAPVAPGQPIELAFDRLLMPLSIVRQTFVLQDVSGNALAPPALAYDPVSRVVTITPQSSAVQPDQTYRLLITTPTSPKDPNGLRAIDGATLDPQWRKPMTIPVLASAPVGTGLQPVDFCSQVLTHLAGCVGLDCHGPPPSSAAGLWLTAAQGVATTALGRAAQGSNTGPTLGAGTAPQAPPLFGVDMPIIDNNRGTSTTGDPGNSWLIYKLLMAIPRAETDGGTPGTVAGATTAYSVAWQPLSAEERAVLTNLVPGREMPFPTHPELPLGADTSAPYTISELETLSFWIAQGAAVPASCN